MERMVYTFVVLMVHCGCVSVCVVGVRVLFPQGHKFTTKATTRPLFTFESRVSVAVTLVAVLSAL